MVDADSHLGTAASDSAVLEALFTQAPLGLFGASTSPHMRRAHATDEGGRGLYLVMTMSHRWGTRYASRGKTVWAQQTLPARTDDGARSTQ
ncbi:ATP-binding protein [Streptomyces sp. NPDC005480]|uniref:ATP-binding protein n=1 Tax=Streptomyces sp. NPDC005480 TaxID=3154880 RepID=UPI0033B8B12C